jgi:hypothetical protein
VVPQKGVEYSGNLSAYDPDFVLHENRIGSQPF